MDAWASGLGISGHQLEEVLFTDEATRRGLANMAGPIRASSSPK
jgi:hypothetical protein